MAFTHLQIAVLIPCYNEQTAIAQLVKAMYAALPSAHIYVYDNNSNDNTASEALSAGAIVRNEKLRGKGNVVRRMFADVDADIYIMLDGDMTYLPSEAPKLVQHLLDNHLDMVVGTRKSISDAAYPKFHILGNNIFNFIITRLFGHGFSDVFSGYRVFTRRFVKSFPAHSSGFEIETELSIHALDLKIPCGELEIAYDKRPEGSQSKLRSFRDGGRILFFIGALFKEVRPLFFFAIISLLCAGISLALGYSLLTEFEQTGLVPRIPTGILATGLGLLSSVSLACGLLLSSVSRSRRETKRLFYLQIPNSFGA